MTAAPSPISDARARDHWVQTAERAQAVINFGWWLNIFVPAFTVTSVVLACLLLLGRKFGVAPELLTLGLFIITVGLGGASYLIARRSFFDRRATLAELDRVLGLNNALTCAELEVGGWPRPQLDESEPTVQWREISLPLAFGSALLLAAAIVPVTRELTGLELNPAAPPAWAETEKILQSIEESGAASQEALKRFEERLESLKAEPEERWYDHSTLEASESLLQDAERAKEELSDKMSSISEALTQARDAAEQRESGNADTLGASASQSREAKAALEQNLRELAEGSMPLSDDLTASLESAASAAETLTKEQAKALHERLDAAKKSLEKGQQAGSSGGKPNPSGAKGEGNNKQPNGAGNGGGKSGEKGDGMTADGGSGVCPPGEQCEGGTSRGPGTAPIEYKDKQSPALATTPELLKGDPEHRDGDREVRQLEKLAPEERRDRVVAGEGGAAQLEVGGDAVVRGDYTPEERRILESYFK